MGTQRRVNRATGRTRFTSGAATKNSNRSRSVWNSLVSGMSAGERKSRGLSAS